MNSARHAHTQAHDPTLRSQMLLTECGDATGWFAEYALAQLAPGSNCSSRPAWVAWMDTVAVAAPESADEEARASAEPVVVLWSQDARAARRAILVWPRARAPFTPVVSPRTSPAGAPAALCVERGAHPAAARIHSAARALRHRGKPGSGEHGVVLSLIHI